MKELTKQKFSKIRAVNIKSLESHLVREDFEKWIAQTFGDAKLAEEIKGLRSTENVGDSLRDHLLRCFNTPEGIETSGLDRKLSCADYPFFAILSPLLFRYTRF